MIVLASFPSRESACRVASVLVEQKLAACAHVSGEGESFYEWEGRICQEREVQLWVKTEAPKWQAVQEQILKLHPYEIPQILGLNVDQSLPAYETWVKKALDSSPYAAGRVT